MLSKGQRGHRSDSDDWLSAHGSHHWHSGSRYPSLGSTNIEQHRSRHPPMSHCLAERCSLEVEGRPDAPYRSSTRWPQSKQVATYHSRQSCWVDEKAHLARAGPADTMVGDQEEEQSKHWLHLSILKCDPSSRALAVLRRRIL